MARRDSVAARKTTRQLWKSPSQDHSCPPSTRMTSKGKRPQGVKKGRQQQAPLRRSARLDPLIDINETSQRPGQQTLPSPVSDANSPAHPRTAPQPSKRSKRKREIEQQPNRPSPKRPRTSSPPSVQSVDPIRCWTRTHHWPRGYFKESGEMSHLLARKKSATSLRRRRSDSESGAPSSTAPSDQKSREEKSAPYKDVRYEALLAAKGSVMDPSDLGVDDTSETLVRWLLEKAQPVPKDSLFREDLFNSTFRKIRNRNETRVIRDVSQLIVPSAEILATYGAAALNCLIESTNEGWNNSIPLTKPRPQPDYAVGFRREAFTGTQLEKLQPFVGDLTDNSFFLGTWYMYFPFFSSEVKCGGVGLDVADRQNAHSMTLAVRGVVELFRLVQREKELHRTILAFSISHDHRSVRIYGHYPVIEGKRTTFYRHPIHTFDFTALNGKEKWTTYKFTKTVYETWVPTHFKRLCSAIDAIPPGIQFEVSEESDLQFLSSSGLPQGQESHHLSGAIADELGLLDSQEATPETSVTAPSKEATFKKPKKKK